MNVLILGSGGREHALSWSIRNSRHLNNLFIAPGNAGTGMLGTNVDLDIMDFGALKTFSLDNDIDMIIVGPEMPLVAGIYDYFLKDEDICHIAVIGPSKAGARLEGSKEFAKQFMSRYNIPTAAYKSVTLDNVDEGDIFLESLSSPYVLKADGLAGGKGVLIVEGLGEAKQTLRDMLKGEFGQASRKVLIEEYMQGIECSAFVLTDGKHYMMLPIAKDYKRIGDGDKGLNTGGMGAVSPVNFADKEFIDKIESKIVIPTMDGLQKENIDYKGFIYFGLMNVKGDPKVVEYNVRLGDPEAEVVLPRIKSDLLDLFIGVSTETLDTKTLSISKRVAVTVIMVSGGYPLKYDKGKRIVGLDDVFDSIVFHSGTRKEGNDILTAGGRVLAVTSYGDNIKKARELSYNNIKKIDFENSYYRTDIGSDLLSMK